MLFYKMTRTAILCAVALMALPLLASARPKATNPQVEKKNIVLDDPATVNGKTLKPGKYEVVIDGNQVKFEQDGQTVVQAPCDWKTMPYKSAYDSTTYSAQHVLQELEFEGSNKALEVM